MITSNHLHCYYHGPSHHHLLSDMTEQPPDNFPASTFTPLQFTLIRATRVIMFKM